MEGLADPMMPRVQLNKTLTPNVNQKKTLELSQLLAKLTSSNPDESEQNS